MKTNIASLLMICIFFLSVSVFADDDKAPKTKALPDWVLGPPNGFHPIIFGSDNGNIIDYVRPKE